MDVLSSAVGHRPAHENVIGNPLPTAADIAYAVRQTGCTGPRQERRYASALSEPGVLDVVARPEVRAENGAWGAYSPHVRGSAVRAVTPTAALLPEPDLRRTFGGPLARLLRAAGCRQPRAHKAFAVGDIAEGVHWVTAAGSRPGAGSYCPTPTQAEVIVAPVAH